MTRASTGKREIGYLRPVSTGREIPIGGFTKANRGPLSEHYLGDKDGKEEQ